MEKIIKREMELMKKIICMCFLMCLIFVGCNERSIEEPASDEVVKITNNPENLSTEVESMSVNIPEWMETYAELQQDFESIYLDEEQQDFAIDNQKFVLPESNILLVAKKIAGRDLEAVNNQGEGILEIIKMIKEAEILDESESNGDASLIGLDFDIIVLLVDSEYAKLSFDIFNDDRIYISVTGENADSDISFWVKSKELAEKIKMISEYEEYDLKDAEKISAIEVIGSGNKNYTLSEDEVNQMKQIIKNLQNQVNECSGPYDIQLVANQDNKQIYMKWCNDGCGILALEGRYYLLDEKDADWLESVINRD